MMENKKGQFVIGGGQPEYYLSEFALAENNAGNKARVDAANIFEKNGIREFVCRKLPPKSGESVFYKIRRYFDLKSGMKRMENLSGARIYVQYPIKVTERMMPSYNKMVEKNQLIYLVHDIESIRMAKGKQEIEAEISKLNVADIVILHNHRMIRCLEEKGLQSKAVDLKIFDYLKETTNEQPHDVQKCSVAFAGNLDKSNFLPEWISMSRQYRLELYGLLSQEKLDTYQKYNDLTYHGSLSPDEIPEKIEGSFGLVWDGTSVETCDGNYGEYLKLNNPHKCSLYLAAGMPVIVWSKSALADFVKERGVGVCVESLHDIDKVFNNMSEDEYHKILINVKKIQKLIVSGSFLTDCINTIRSAE